MMYLSPDLKYLSPELLDTSSDPSAFWRLQAQATQKALLQGLTSRTNPNVPVTIVEFADFQCPFCRTFAETFDKLPEKWRGEVQLVFRHMPLPMHDWAMLAAQAAACAEDQSETLFWQFHRFFFDNQTLITGQNAKAEVEQIANSTSNLDIPSFELCLNTEHARIRNDRQIADRYRISGTPTVFFNGVRKPTPFSLPDLKRLIDEALADVRRSRSGHSEDDLPAVITRN